MYQLVSHILRSNRLERRNYAEPFAGGCGLALTLLYGGHVSDIHINDIDSSIWAFWYSVLNHTDELGELIMQTPLTLDEWHRQRAIYLAHEVERPVELGFATLFLNRTNRSGIVESGGVIGGKGQGGKYVIACRFNRDGIRQRVERVRKYRDRIYLYRRDGCDFLKWACGRLPNTSFLFVDPPYVSGSRRLYRNLMSSGDHVRLAERLCSVGNPWLATYDDAASIRRLYADRRQCELNVRYSLKRKRRETEILIASKGLRLPASVREHLVNRPRTVRDRAKAFVAGV